MSEECLRSKSDSNMFEDSAGICLRTASWTCLRRVSEDDIFDVIFKGDVSEENF